MAHVLLINMPFASITYPSMGLSVLQPALTAQGIACDVSYANVLFRSYVQDNDAYDDLCDTPLLGDWIFGAALFGPEWASSQMGGIEAVQKLLAERSTMKDQNGFCQRLEAFRQAADGFLKQYRDSIAWEQYDLIGFTSVFAQHTASLALAKQLKQEYPEKIIAFGGANCGGEMGVALMDHFPFVDWVFTGEADLAFPEAILRWQQGRSLAGLPGAAYREGGTAIQQGIGSVINPDVLPVPEFDDYYAAIDRDAAAVRASIPLTLEFSRGCWWGAVSQCIFCGLNHGGIAFRSKSPERVLAEVKAVVSRYKNTKLRLIDNNLDPKYFLTVLPELAKMGLTGFFVETKADLDREQLLALKKAGTDMFQPGIESLDTEILQLMRKGTTMLINVRFLKWARDYGLQPMWNFMHSFPGESRESYRRIAQLIPLLIHLQPPADTTPVILQRYSPLYEQQQTFAITDVRAHPAYQRLYPFAPEELDRIAYSFVYKNCSGDESLETRERTYQQDALTAVSHWQEAWKRHEPPCLAAVQESGGLLTIYDSRPIRCQPEQRLNQIQSLLLSSCDRGTPWQIIQEQAKNHLGSDYPGNDALAAEMKTLQEWGYVLEERQQYLSLVNDMDNLAEHGNSMLARLFLSK